MLFSIFINYWFEIWLNKDRLSSTNRTVILTIAIVVNTAILGYFKYANFLVDNINDIFHTNIVLEKIPLQLGFHFSLSMQ